MDGQALCLVLILLQAHRFLNREGCDFRCFEIAREDSTSHNEVHLCEKNYIQIMTAAYHGLCLNMAQHYTERLHLAHADAQCAIIYHLP